MLLGVFGALLMAPLVWLLDISGRLILGLLGQAGETGERVTDEEVKTIIAEAESAGSSSPARVTPSTV